ncbi:MAG: dihydroorotate dehydrogenase electron transfer subunit [Bacteroidales bacterium]
MVKIVSDHTLVDIHYPVEGNYIIRLQSPEEIPPVRPGNFAEIKVPKSPDVFLRRPFSILDVDYKNRIISFYIKIIGKGTQQLGEVKKGEKVNLIYPLGNSFTLPEPGKKVLIVGGGSGIAPFILLGKELQKNNNPVTFLVGGRSKKDILLTEEFSKYGEVITTTEDGSIGEKGLVTQHSVFNSLDVDKIYTCGPDPMMKAIGKIAVERNIECEVSLENMMACGFGVCLCCVTATEEGNKRVCIEGPVFNVNYLKWQI